MIKEGSGMDGNDVDTVPLFLEKWNMVSSCVGILDIALTSTCSTISIISVSFSSAGLLDLDLLTL
jgi:hypothetical protein